MARKQQQVIKRYGKEVALTPDGRMDPMETIRINAKGYSHLEQEKMKLREEMKALSHLKTEEEIRLEKEKQEKERQAIDDAFAEWLETDHSSVYNTIKILRDNHVIIKVFYYYTLPVTSIIITDTVTSSFHKIFPIAKVVASSYEKLSPGDIVRLPATRAINKQSEQWVQYQKDIREQPSLKDSVPEPPAYVGRLTEWQDNIFKLDPFSEINIDDQHTFCIPYSFLQASDV